MRCIVILMKVSILLDKAELMPVAQHGEEGAI